MPSGTLTVHAVETMRIKDRAGTGWIDLNRIDFDSAAGEVRISSGFPVEIVCTVDDLKVEFTSVGETPTS